MSDEQAGYRAFPKNINSPWKVETISKEEFSKADKVQMDKAKSACAGHKETVVWYSESLRSYVVEVIFDAKPTIYALSLCTFTPSFGMDIIDGQFAQDVEEYILFKELGYFSERLKIFEGKDSVEIEKYFRARGIFKD